MATQYFDNIVAQAGHIGKWEITEGSLTGGGIILDSQGTIHAGSILIDGTTSTIEAGDVKIEGSGIIHVGNSILSANEFTVSGTINISGDTTITGALWVGGNVIAFGSADFGGGALKVDLTGVYANSLDVDGTADIVNLKCTSYLAVSKKATFSGTATFGGTTTFSGTLGGTGFTTAVDDIISNYIKNNLETVKTKLKLGNLAFKDSVSGSATTTASVPAEGATSVSVKVTMDLD